MYSLKTIFNAVKQALDKKASIEYVDAKFQNIPKPDVTKAWVNRQLQSKADDEDLNDLSSQVALNNMLIRNDVDNIRNVVDGNTSSISYLNGIISTLRNFEIEVRTQLPTYGESSKLYLVPNAKHETNNYYDEYVWVVSRNAYEKVGSTEIDLSNYPTISQMNTAIHNAVGAALEASY